MSISSRIKAAEETPGFFRYHYDKVIMLLIMFILGVLVAASVVMYQVYHRPIPTFAAVTPGKQTMPLIASTSPILIPKTLITWASKAAVASYTFDFVNYQKQINETRPYFTSAGWADYQSSISNLIATIRQNQLFVTGVIVGPPIISNQGDLPGIGFAWRVQLPFLVTYASSEETTQKKFTMLITIVRVPTQVNPKGIGIDQLVMR